MRLPFVAASTFSLSLFQSEPSQLAAVKFMFHAARWRVASSLAGRPGRRGLSLSSSAVADKQNYKALSLALACNEYNSVVRSYAERWPLRTWSKHMAGRYGVYSAQFDMLRDMRSAWQPQHNTSIFTTLLLNFTSCDFV